MRLAVRGGGKAVCDPLRWLFGGGRKAAGSVPLYIAAGPPRTPDSSPKLGPIRVRFHRLSKSESPATCTQASPSRPKGEYIQPTKRLGTAHETRRARSHTHTTAVRRRESLARHARAYSPSRTPKAERSRPFAKRKRTPTPAEPDLLGLSTATSSASPSTPRKGGGVGVPAPDSLTNGAAPHAGPELGRDEPAAAGLTDVTGPKK